MAAIQNAAISGYLCSEQMKWSKLWFVVYNKFLFQFADKTSQQPQCGMPLSGTITRLEPNNPRPHCFSIRCTGGVVILSAESDQEATDWVNAINREIDPSIQPSVPQQTQIQPNSAAFHHQHAPSVFVNPSGGSPPGSPLQKQPASPTVGPSLPQSPESAPIGNEISPETFWSNSFGKLEEASWSLLVDELSTALGIDLHSEELYSPFYCVANVVAEGSLTLRGTISRTNFRLFVALFGPLSACAAKCKDLIDSGMFHGEITSQEADERLKAADVVGGFLVRLRKGSRHQVALAFMDSQKVTKHILLDVNQNQYCIHQLAAVFPSIPKLTFAYRSKFIQVVPFPLMNHFGPNATSANISNASGHSGTIPGAAPSTPKVDTSSISDTKGMSFSELESLFSAIASEANALVASRPPQIAAGTTEALLLEKGRQLMNDLVISKQHIVAIALSEKPFIVDPGLGAGPSNAGYLQQVLSKTKPSIMCNIRVPALEVQGKRNLTGSCLRQEALDKIIRGAQIKERDKLGLYLPASGIWTDPNRPLSSYLLVPGDNIDVLYIPQQENPCVVSVKNTLTGETENVPIDDHTTIFGLIQAVKKPDLEHIAQSGIRIRSAAGSFFCDPTKLCTDYQVGLSIKNVEYGVVSVGEQFIPPNFAPLDKVPPLMAALGSNLANVASVKKLTLQLAENQRALQLLKSGDYVPTRSGAIVPVDPAAALKQFEEEDDHTQPKPYTALPALQLDLSTESVPAQLLAVPDTASANGSVVYGTQINLPGGTAEASEDIVSQTKWLMDVTYLGTWWSSITAEQRKKAENLQRARTLVRSLFDDTSKATKARRMTLLNESVFSKEQLVSIAQCLSDVASK